LMLAGMSGIVLHAGAFAGAFLSMLLVFVLARGAGSWTPTRLLLTGVVLAAGWGAVITFLLSIAPEHNLRGMLFWLMGDLSYAHATWLGMLVLLLGLTLGLLQARALNLLATGQLHAKTLGVEVERLQWQLFALASLLTAVAVMQAGSIGFIGLIVPHVLRLAGLHDHRYLLPASVTTGGGLLVVADALARSLFITVALPVGVITALLGVPVFLWLLRHHARQRP
jgi:iron complex transport system permease protein